MVSNPMHLASYPSQWLNLVCKIPISFFSLLETNTIGYYGVFGARHTTRFYGWYNIAKQSVTFCDVHNDMH